VLIVLEDVHWADPATLLVARAVADAIPPLP
jgi:predicted ATPase